VPAVDMDMIAAGISTAARTGIPIVVDGEPVIVPPEMAEPVSPEPVDPSTLPVRLRPGSPGFEFEIARSLAFILTSAGSDIGRLGLEIGALAAPPQAAPAPIREATKHVPTPLPTINVVERADGSLIVDGFIEVRPPSGRGDWMVTDVSQQRNMIQGWHSTKDAALQWVRDLINRPFLQEGPFSQKRKSS
jgi:hypothetical protein